MIKYNNSIPNITNNGSWHIYVNTTWSEDEYITNVGAQLNNLINSKYYKQAVISTKWEIYICHDDSWINTKKWINDLVHQLYYIKK